MIFDRHAFLAKEQESSRRQLATLEFQLREANRSEKERITALMKATEDEMLQSDPHLCYYLLAVEGKESADALRSAWVTKSMSTDSAPKPMWSGWSDMAEPKFNLSILPRYSFAIQFIFKLAKPYISMDEQEFFIIDNPVRKEKVFSLPYVAPSSWKGSLRSALWQLDHKGKDEQVQRLFGNERNIEDDSKLRKARLHFYPTFFTEKSLEVINPHNRKMRVGTHPIYFESVGIDVEGSFSILYLSFDMLKLSELESRRQVASDLKLVCEGLQSMFTVYGFGAKTSSGFGVAQPDLIDGKMVLKAPMNSKHPQSKVDRKRELPVWTFKNFDELVKRGEEVRAVLAGNEGASQ